MVASTFRSNEQQTLFHALVVGDERITARFYQEVWHNCQTFFFRRFPPHCRPLWEDCFSEAFLLALQKMKAPGFQAVNLQGFAFAIVYRRVTNQLRRQNRFRTLPLDCTPEPGCAKPDHCLSAADLFYQHGNTPQWEWFQNLPERNQHLLHLYHLGFNQEEIAQQLGMTHGSVRNLYRKLVKKARLLGRQDL